VETALPRRASRHEDGRDDRPAAVRVTRWVAGLWPRLQRVTVYEWGLVAFVAAYTTYFTSTTLEVHHGLGTSAYDFGLYDQGVWLMSQFKAPFVTLMGRNLLGDHTSFILVFLVPLYWIWPSAGVLFFTQSLFIALGAVPVFLLARKLLLHEGFALALAACYLLHPAA